MGTSRDGFYRQLPMIATYIRMGLAPFIVALLATDWAWSGWVCAFIFILASLTDWLDGYLARRFKAESVMGQFMDPIADKILVTATLIMLLYLQRLDPYMVIVLLVRDTYIGGLRSVAAASSVIISAKPFGKWKTAIQMVCIPCLLVYDSLWGIPLKEIGYYGLWMSVVLSLISAVQYSVGYYKGRQ